MCSGTSISHGLNANTPWARTHVQSNARILQNSSERPAAEGSCRGLGNQCGWFRCRSHHPSRSPVYPLSQQSLEPKLQRGSRLCLACLLEDELAPAVRFDVDGHVGKRVVAVLVCPIPFARNRGLARGVGLEAVLVRLREGEGDGEVEEQEEEGEELHAGWCSVKVRLVGVVVLVGSRLTRLVGACGCGVLVWSVKKAEGKGAFVSGFVLRAY
jgi:hypothetical protein